MSSSKGALLIGGISHARKDWEALSSLLQLKVGNEQAVPDLVLTFVGIRKWIARGLSVQAQIRRVQRRGRNLPKQRLHERNGPFQQRIGR